MSENGEFGPAMSKLTPKQQRFVLAYFEFPRRHGRITYAAKAAGFGTPTSTRNSLSVIGYQLIHTEAIQRAIEEQARQRVVALAPLALHALEKQLEDPKADSHGRALGLVLERIAPQETTLNVRHDATPAAVNVAATMERIAHLTAKFCRPALPTPKIIDAEMSE